MVIGCLKKEDIPHLCEFYKLPHPENTDAEIKAFIEHWLSKVSNSLEYVSIQKENNQIVGLDFNSPMDYFLGGKIYKSGWGFDLYVKQEYRENNYGVDLLLYNKNKFPTNFATGSNPTAAKILKKMGGKQIGEIHKYVGVVNPLGIIRSICGGRILAKSFPEDINLGSHNFTKIGIEDLPDILTPYNKGILEINHNYDFLKWKFFNSYREYAFYIDKQTNNYVVFRTIEKKHITMLMMTDYRCNIQSESELEQLFQVAKKVACEIGIAFLYCGSSLAAVDKIFEHHSCRAIGRHRPIITFDKNCKKTEYDEDIANRSFVFITLSDSDGEPL